MRKFMTIVAATTVSAVLLGAGGATASSLMGSSQIRDNSIRSQDIKNGTIKSTDMSYSAKAALKGKSGPAGPAGPAGPINASALTPVSSGNVYFTTDTVESATVNCPAGMRIVSGGGVSISDSGMYVSDSLPSRTGWIVIGVDQASSDAYVKADALCATANTATLASTGKDKAYVAQLMEQAKAEQDK